MARKARGRDLLEQAKGYLSKAKTAEEFTCMKKNTCYLRSFYLVGKKK